MVAKADGTAIGVMRAAIYIRVSTDMQAEEGFSIEGQRSRLTSFSESQDWSIYDFYVDDGYSAKDLKRPDMQRMLADMEERKFDVVLVYKLDRLTRSVADLHALLKTFDLHGVKFKSSTEIFETTTAMGRFFITLVGAMAEWERGTISERVRFGVEQMVAEGRRPGGVLPYGYTQQGQLIPEEAELIREVRDMYLSGMGYKTIAMKLNRSDKQRRGHDWTDGTVGYTLENPFYAGIIRLGSKTAAGTYVNSKRDERVKCIYGKGSHEAIFTQEEYDEIKAFMARKAKGGYSRINTYWFSGVLRCGRCGAAMFGRLTTKRTTTKGDVRTQYYICSNRHHIKTCDLPIFRQIHVEHLVLQYIERLQVDMERLKEEAQRITEDEGKKKTEIDKEKRELAKISERREKWQYMFVEGLISKEDIRKKIAEEDLKERAVRQRIADNQKSLSGIPRLTELAGLADAWPYLDDQEKKDLVYTLFSQIVINTDLKQVKGVKNKFFDAYIQDITFN
ncbi:site-specific DNA recombinase [Paenibacillus sophorae]|uniref:Recombinase family protein n=1 Tax=Paenibacillus sophorae TaxID=1333845 RepID=A0A1H8LDK5_9BACL|nr:recombinase family protein [Paenibacillus sophorae]QWU17335.1 recombinase family protein [Paenibacillus sophorae]SEO02886.1 site-specific DNA recombinase [Paenibacillus sophorae]